MTKQHNYVSVDVRMPDYAFDAVFELSKVFNTDFDYMLYELALAGCRAVHSGVFEFGKYDSDAFAIVDKH